MSSVNVQNILRKSLLSGFITGIQPEKANRDKSSGMGRVERLMPNTLDVWVVFDNHEGRFMRTKTPESPS